MKERHELQVVEDGKHWGDAEGLRASKLLRGRVLVHVEPVKPTSPLWTPEQSEWNKGTRVAVVPHWGRVVAMGPPARTPVSWRGTGGVDVPHGFEIGSRILFVYAVALEKTRSFAGGLCIVAQEEIIAVDDDPPPVPVVERGVS